MNFVFDLYGTLIDILTDEESPILWKETCKLLGEDVNRWKMVKEEYSALCKDKIRSQFHEIDLIEVFSDMIHKRGAEIKPQDLATSFRKSSIIRLKLFPFVKELLSKLKDFGAGVYLLSNAQACFTWGELDELGLTELFDEILLSSDEGVKKPSIEIFKRAFAKFGIDKTGTYYVGNDMFDDVSGAAGAGLHTVYIPTEQSGRYDELHLPTPDYSITDHRKLYETLISIAQGNK